MTIKLTPHTIDETIKFIIARHERDLKQILADVQDTDHAHYKKYSFCRPRLWTIYLEGSERLQGLIFLFSDCGRITDRLKAAQKACHIDWTLHDFQIIALQRPGTKPPFFINEDQKDAA